MSGQGSLLPGNMRPPLPSTVAMIYNYSPKRGGLTQDRRQLKDNLGCGTMKALELEPLGVWQGRALSNSLSLLWEAFEDAGKVCVLGAGL